MVFEFFKNIDFQSVQKSLIFDFLCICIGGVKGLKRGWIKEIDNIISYSPKNFNGRYCV